jgi:hypothetical protein
MPDKNNLSMGWSEFSSLINLHLRLRTDRPVSKFFGRLQNDAITTPPQPRHIAKVGCHERRQKQLFNY